MIKNEGGTIEIYDKKDKLILQLLEDKVKTPKQEMKYCEINRIYNKSPIYWLINKEKNESIVILIDNPNELNYVINIIKSKMDYYKGEKDAESVLSNKKKYIEIGHSNIKMVLEFVVGEILLILLQISPLIRIFKILSIINFIMLLFASISIIYIFINIKNFKKVVELKIFKNKIEIYKNGLIDLEVNNSDIDQIYLDKQQNKIILKMNNTKEIEIEASTKSKEYLQGILNKMINEIKKNY